MLRGDFVRNRSSARVRGLTLCVGIPLLLAPLSADTPSMAAPISPVPADSVGFVRVPTSTGFDFELHCLGAPRWDEFVFASGLEFQNFSMPTVMLVQPHNSSTGHLIQIADRQVVTYEERLEQRVEGSTAIQIWGSESGPGVFHFAWASWGGGLEGCTFKVDGAARTVGWLDGDAAIYVGPEAFTGGLFYQDGGTQASIGRLFATQIEHPVVMGTLRIGSERGHATAESGDALHGGGITCGSSCNFGWPQARFFYAEITLGLEFNGGPHAELWVFNTP